MHRGTSSAVGYSDWWGQVGMIGGGGLLPVYWDSVTGMWGSMQSMVTVPLCQYGIYMGDSQ